MATSAAARQRVADALCQGVSSASSFAGRRPWRRRMAASALATMASAIRLLGLVLLSLHDEKGASDHHDHGHQQADSHASRRLQSLLSSVALKLRLANLREQRQLLGNLFVQEAKRPGRSRPYRGRGPRRPGWLQGFRPWRARCLPRAHTPPGSRTGPAHRTRSCCGRLLPFSSRRRRGRRAEMLSECERYWRTASWKATMLA